jgi:glycine hydroxymethyltransferase
MKDHIPHDAELHHLITDEEARQSTFLNLIASENHTSPQVRRAVGSVLAHKYAEGLPRKRYYGGCEVVDEVEQLAITRAKEIFGASWANVQPHAGSQANAAVLQALLSLGDRILGFNLNHGGHLTHGSPVNFSGKLYQASFYGVSEETGMVAMDEVAKAAHKAKPKLIICGGSSYSRDWDYAQLRAIADEVGAYLLADIAHPAGLIARGLLRNPIPHCHVITTTTHKTLRGPRGGMILMGEDMENRHGIRDRKGKLRNVSSLLDSGVFPGTQGGPHMNNIAGKAVAFHEVETEEYLSYVQEVQRSAEVLGSALAARGYHIVSGGTDNHMILLDLRAQGITGKQAETVLAKAGIIVNKNLIPFDPESPFITSGIRIGTPTIITRGLGAVDMAQVAAWIDDALQQNGDEGALKRIAGEVMVVMGRYPLFASRRRKRK